MKSGIIAITLGLAFTAIVGCSSTKKVESEPLTTTQSTDAAPVATASNDANLGASSSGFSH